MPVYRVINYTDYHDVDEDLRTISLQGGRWINELIGGITERNMSDSPTSSGDYVASKKYTQRILSLCIFDTRSLLSNSIIMHRHF